MFLSICQDTPKSLTNGPILVILSSAKSTSRIRRESCERLWSKTDGHCTTMSTEQRNNERPSCKSSCKTSLTCKVDYTWRRCQHSGSNAARPWKLTSLNVPNSSWVNNRAYYTRRGGSRNQSGMGGMVLMPHSYVRRFQIGRSRSDSEQPSEAIS
jgi:hypothetical protein